MTSDATMRLASIVCVDVAGYSARTEADAAGSAREILAIRERLNAVAKRLGGRVFSTAGDSVLMEFAAARQAAAAIFALLDERPEDEPPLRVGAHLGDVSVAADGDLLGHGVNVAARLAAAAEPGRALISRELRAAMVGAVERPMRSLGELTLPKMQTAVAAFEIAPADAAPTPNAAARPTASDRSAIAIAVMPFVNMSPDRDQEYFSDGITEDIITDLSRWRMLAVSSRNSTFRYKGEPVDAKKVGAELGVRFVVEGSVRRAGDRVRVSAQLVDAESGAQVWAERFDRPAADLFDVQDEVVRTIVGTLAGRVQEREAERLRRKPPSSLAAYELTLRGNWLNWSDPALNAEARKAFEKAIELDPEYGLPHSLLAVMLRLAWVDDLAAPDDLLDRALAMAQRGVELATSENASHMSLAYVHLYRREFERAERYIGRALELNPANPRNQAEYGMMLPFLGRAEEAVRILAMARQADPYLGPHWYWHSLGLSKFALRRYEEALADFEQSGMQRPRAFALVAGCCAKLGQPDKAHASLTRLEGATVGQLLTKIPFKREEDNAHLRECLRLAGVPD